MTPHIVDSLVDPQSAAASNVYVDPLKKSNELLVVPRHVEISLF